MSHACKVQTKKTNKPNNKGISTVQQYDINWSKRILGKEALTHMKTNTRKELFIPIIIPEYSPDSENFIANSLDLKNSGELVQSISTT
jgi:hypothetical protein